MGSVVESGERDKISIIIPVYRVEPYLRRCLDSVINQTYKNLEIIIVDDGSNDMCPQICDEYAAMDDRIIVIHKDNGGLSDARNAGIAIASGSYIGFVDSDDWVAEDMYEILLRKAIEYKADIAICSYYIVKDNKIHISYQVYDDILYSSNDALMKLIYNQEIQTIVWDKLYKMELFKEIRYPKGHNYEDLATVYKLFSLSKVIVRIGDTKYYYVRRSGSITSSKNIGNEYDLFAAHNQRYMDLAGVYPLAESKLYSDAFTRGLKLYHKFIIENRKFRKENTAIKYEVKNHIKEYRKSKNFNLIKASYRFCTALVLMNLFFYDTIFRLFYRIYVKFPSLHIFYHIFKGIIEYQDIKKIPITRTKKPAIILMGTPGHNNMGDHSIAYAELQYLKDNFPDYSFIEIPDNKIYYYWHYLKRYIKDTDIILCHGGGNIGNQYQHHENIRRKVIRTFPKNKVLIFPQTIYFSNDNNGNKQLNITKRIYSKHKNLTIIAREQFTYEKLRMHFTHNTILLTPDMVLYLTKRKANVKRSGVLLCLRDDVEGIIEDGDKQLIREKAIHHYDKVIETDTCVDRPINMVVRNIALEAKWHQFLEAELVITDRLHGMVFAAITETSCICLSNYNYKVEGTYNWIKKLPYITYISNLDQLEGAITTLRGIKSEEMVYDNTYAIKYYDHITEEILLEKNSPKMKEWFDYGTP